MKNFDKHYQRLKSLLENPSGLSTDDLRKEYELANMAAIKDTTLLDYDDADRDVIAALMHRIERMHSLGRHDYARDEISQLSFYPQGYVSLTFHSHWNQLSEKELYQPVMDYLNSMLKKGGKYGSKEEQFYPDESFHKVSEEQMKDFVQSLTKSTHWIADHIMEYASNNWAWKPDIYAYVFYTFEKFFEYTYHMVLGEEYDLVFEPDALYDSPNLALPINLERRMYIKEESLHVVVKDLLDFIEETDICNSDNIIWVRTIMFNIGLAAFQTVCRTREL